MSIPQYPKNHLSKVSITPRQHLEAEGANLNAFQPPKAAILCFEQSLIAHYRSKESNTVQRFWTGELVFLGERNNAIALVGNFGIGGPAAGHMLEALIALGVSSFMSIGHAGGLQPCNPIGSMILVEKAIRDEGLSHHYADSAPFAYASQSLTKKLSSTLEKMKQSFSFGSSWTIDSMYRETMEEIAHYQSEGIDAVEMELASLFTVASFRKVDLAALLVISDYIGGDSWEEEIRASETFVALLKASEVAIKALSGR